MGLGGINIWSLLIILVIVLLLFGTKRLKNLGGDLGGAIKGFKNALGDADKANSDKAASDEAADAKNIEQQQAESEDTVKTDRKVEK
jgi:sec-independent protein translocase protein TatA